LPGSLEEVEEAEEYLRKGQEANPDDPALISQLNDTREILDDAVIRKFTGSKWIIIGLGAFVLIVTWFMGVNRLFFDGDLEGAKQIIQMEINYRTNAISRLELKNNQVTGKEKMIERYKKEIAQFKKTTPEQYLVEWEKREFYDGIWFILRQIPWMILIVLYYIVSRPPQYIINRRRKEMEVISAGTGLFKKIAFGILAFFWSMPITFTTTRWSDGTTETTSDAGPVLMIQLAVTGFVLAIIIWAMMILLPFMVLVNYLRNYQFKRLDAAFTRVTDRVLGFFGKA
jgi:hypothetical protein